MARQLDLNIAGADLTNVMIPVSIGRRVSGPVTVDGEKPLPDNVFVILDPVNGERDNQLSSPTLANGTFTIAGVPAGKYLVRTAVPPNQKYYTKSVMHRHSELARDLITVEEDQDLTNFVIVISFDVALVSGRALAADGKRALGGVGVLFVSADSVEKKIITRRIYGFTNAGGEFSVSGAPGDYLALVMRPGEGYNQLGGGELISRAAKAQRITLQPGENKSIDLLLPSER